MVSLAVGDVVPIPMFPLASITKGLVSLDVSLTRKLRPVPVLVMVKASPEPPPSREKEAVVPEWTSAPRLFTEKRLEESESLTVNAVAPALSPSVCVKSPELEIIVRVVLLVSNAILWLSFVPSVAVAPNELPPCLKYVPSRTVETSCH